MNYLPYPPQQQRYYQPPAYNRGFDPEYVKYVIEAANVIDYYGGNHDGYIDAREAQLAGDYFNFLGDDNFTALFDELATRLQYRDNDPYFKDGYLSYWNPYGTNEFQEIAELRGTTGSNAVFSMSDLDELAYYQQKPYDYRDMFNDNRYQYFYAPRSNNDRRYYY